MKGHSSAMVKNPDGRTGEQQPQFSPEPLRDSVEDQLPGSGGTVHANSSAKLREVDVPGLLLHFLLHLQRKHTQNVAEGASCWSDSGTTAPF